MNGLVSMDFSKFGDVIEDVTQRTGALLLREIVDRLELPIPDELIRDRPDLFERGFLEVVDRRRFDESLQENEAESRRTRSNSLDELR